MKRFLTILLLISSSGWLINAAAEDFLTDPSLLQNDPRFGDDLVYVPADIEGRMQRYDSVMVDEPEIFVAPDSPYTGFKASDMAVLADTMRRAYIEGLAAESASLKVVDEPSASTLYLRLALKNIYIKKKQRGLFAYTPVGAVMKGAHDIASDAIDKSTLVELTVEGELHDSMTKETQAAFHMKRGQHKDQSHQEQVAEWEITGAIAEALGRRLGCQLDSLRLAEGLKPGCITEIPMPD